VRGGHLGKPGGEAVRRPDLQQRLGQRCVEGDEGAQPLELAALRRCRPALGHACRFLAAAQAVK
jgi:hypothetical protein